LALRTSNRVDPERLSAGAETHQGRDEERYSYGEQEGAKYVEKPVVVAHGGHWFLLPRGWRVRFFGRRYIADARASMEFDQNLCQDVSCRGWRPASAKLPRSNVSFLTAGHLDTLTDRIEQSPTLQALHTVLVDVWVDMMSLGNDDLSTSSTRYPFRASSIAVGEPAHRAPTMMASYIIFLPSPRSLRACTITHTSCFKAPLAARNSRPDYTRRRAASRRRIAWS
jgi:hypothetical protein